KDAGSTLLIEAVRAAARGDALVSPAVTVRLLKHLAGQQPPAAVPHPLSERELDVVRLVAVGRTNQEVCGELYVSLGTVKSHLSNIKDKIGVRNRVEIAAWAWDTGLVRDRQTPPT
ncbi:response regulator transcription factor, partial [Streptomyces sp. NPDC050619]|uniref:response regulator transcription factor n=1 Tax=Streptomyces sp. NPDC050619 TaxID=3157214 RepID=UPI00343FB8ED